MRASATRAVAGTSSRPTESGGCSALAGGACGLGGTYGLLPLAVPWMEASSGVGYPGIRDKTAEEHWGANPHFAPSESGLLKPSVSPEEPNQKVFGYGCESRPTKGKAAARSVARLATASVTAKRSHASVRAGGFRPRNTTLFSEAETSTKVEGNSRYRHYRPRRAGVRRGV